jgi:hypothetical protein
MVPMATAVPAGSIVQVTPRFDLEGQKCENVMYFRCHNDSTDLIADLLLVIAQCIITHLLPVFGSNFTLEQVHGKVVGPALGAEDEWTPASGDTVQGAVLTDTMPSHDCAVISLYTTQAGRSGRGRMRMGGIAAADTQGSLLKIEAPTWAALIAFAQCLITNFPQAELGTGAHFEWGVYSRKLGGAVKPPFPDAGFHAVTRAVPKRELGTCRSRKLGHGK